MGGVVKYKVRGFTLLELQISLLLTIMVFSLLFLFTFYFHKNNQAYTDLFAAEREAGTFFTWIDDTLRNSYQIQTGKQSWRFLLLDGTERELVVNDNGPVYAGVVFFQESVEADLLFEGPAQKLTCRISIKRGDRVFQFQAEHPRPAYLGLGRRP